MSRVTVSEERRAAIVRTYAAGKSIHETAQAIGVPISTAEYWITRAGIMRPRNVNAWSPEQEAILRKLVGEGLRSSQIGPLLGKSRSAVCGRCRRLGLSLPGVQKAERAPRAPRVRKRKPLGLTRRVAAAECLRGLTDRGRIFAERFLAAGWQHREVAYLFDCSEDDLMGRAA